MKNVLDRLTIRTSKVSKVSETGDFTKIIREQLRSTTWTVPASVDNVADGQRNDFHVNLAACNLLRASEVLQNTAPETIKLSFPNLAF